MFFIAKRTQMTSLKSFSGGSLRSHNKFDMFIYLFSRLHCEAQTQQITYGGRVINFYLIGADAV